MDLFRTQQNSGSTFSGSRSRNLFWLTIVRLVIGSGALAYLIYFYPPGNISSEIRPYYYLIGTVLGLSFLYVLWHRSGKRVRLLAYIQILFDLLSISFLTYLTGGVYNSVYFLLFFATVMYSPMVSGERTGLLTASIGTILVSGVSILYVYAAQPNLGFSLPFVPRREITLFDLRLRTVLLYLVYFGVVLHFVGYLSGLLVTRIGLHWDLTREILRNMDEGLAVIDRQGRVEFHNDQLIDLLSGAETDVREEPDHVTGLLPDSISDRVTSVLEEGTGGTWELKLPGEERDRFLLVTVGDNPITSPPNMNREDMFVLIARDISDRMEAEEARDRIRSLRAMSRMAGSIGHEIRNPLASIRGAAQELRSMHEDESDQEDSDVVQLMNIVVSESERMDRIVGDVMEMAHETDIQRESVPVKDCVRNTLNSLARRNIKEEREVKSEIPSDLLIQGDRDHLEQVLRNLVENALDHTEEGELIQIRAERTHEQVFSENDRGARSSEKKVGTVIHVLDEGPGFPEKDRERILDPFYTTRDGGTGLGLSICSKIVRAHGGYIDIKNRAGGGAHISFWIPDEHRSQT